MTAKTRVHNPGFTIVELLIVIVVIAILAAITVVAFNGVQQRARDSQRQDDVNKIAKGLQMWAVETGKPFSQMNSGNTMPADGYFEVNYGGGSVRDILANSKYISSSTNDPQYNPAINRHRYMLAPCSNAADDRRVVMTELEFPPTKTISEQLNGTGCNSTVITTYQNVYFMNLAKVVSGS